MRVVLDIAPPTADQPLDPTTWTPLAEHLETLLEPLTAGPEVELDTVFGAAGAIVAISDPDVRNEDAMQRIKTSVEDSIAGSEFGDWSIVGVTWDDGSQSS